MSAQWLSIPGFAGKIFRMQLSLDALEYREMATGAHDRKTLETLGDLGNDAVLWDIGAHVGYVSLLLGTHPRVRSIQAFEPHPENAQRLQAHVSANAAPVGVHELALGEVPGRAMFKLFPAVDAAQSTGGHLEGVKVPLAPECYAGFKPVEVQVETGDRMAQKLGFPDLIKIDVEGAEVQVLRGCREILDTTRPALLVETHGITAHRGTREWLAGFGYEFQILAELAAGRMHVLCVAAN